MITDYIEYKNKIDNIRDIELYTNCYKRLTATINFLTNEIYYTVIYDSTKEEVFNDYEFAVNFYNRVYTERRFI